MAFLSAEEGLTVVETVLRDRLENIKGELSETASRADLTVLSDELDAELIASAKKLPMVAERELLTQALSDPSSRSSVLLARVLIARRIDHAVLMYAHFRQIAQTNEDDDEVAFSASQSDAYRAELMVLVDQYDRLPSGIETPDARPE